MKILPYKFISVLLMVASCFITSCEDWESGSQANFNSTSEDLAVLLGELSVAGTYSGTLTGGLAVSDPFNGTISTLFIEQNGGSLTVTDNQGESTWTGSVSEAFIEDVDPVFINNGQTLASFTVQWTGFDEVAIDQIVFTGTIELIYDDSRTPNSYFVLSGTWVETLFINGNISVVGAEAPGPQINL